MSAKAFLDTNILIYAFTQNDPRGAKAEQLLASVGSISVQVLNEFAAVARRKLNMAWPDLTDALTAIRALCAPPIALSVDIHDRAITIARRDGYTIYDALIIAAALKESCDILYSEDLQDGRVFDGKLTLRNPFLV